MLKNNKINFVIALLISIVLWAYVFGEINPSSGTTFRNIPITFSGERVLAADGYVMTSSDIGAVNVTISGQRSNTSKVKGTDFKVTADLTGLQKGTHDILLQVISPEGITVDSVSYQKVRVVIENLVTESRTVKTEITGQTSPDSEPNILKINHKTVNITGAESLVSRVAYVRAQLNTADVKGDIQVINVPLVPVDENGNEVKDPDISLDIDPDSVSITTVMISKKTLPLDVPVNEPENASVTRSVSVPAVITVKGADSIISGLQSITCETIDISEIFTDTEIILKPILPDGVEISTDSENLKATVSVIDAGMKEFAYSPNDVSVTGLSELYANVGDRFAITVPTDEIKLSIFGKAEDVALAEAEDFILSADATDFFTEEEILPGEYPIPIDVESEKEFDSIKCIPEIYMIVIEAEQEPEEEPEA